MPITIRKKSNVTQTIDAEMIMINSFFAHWIREANIKRYGDDITILPLNKVIEIFCYSEAMLKHLSRKSLETFQNKLLYSNKLFKRTVFLIEETTMQMIRMIDQIQTLMN